MRHLGYLLFLTGTLIAQSTAAQQNATTGLSPRPTTIVAPVSPDAPTTWSVQTSLRSTLRVWAQRQGWPKPQFLTEADWAVDVPGSVSGSIEDALRVLAEGFSQAPTRPRIAVTGNHVILVSEVGAE